jgi:hypothetical protein
MTPNAKWSEKFLAPEGGVPEDLPPPQRPSDIADKTAMNTYYSANDSWRRAASIRNKWIITDRKHRVAMAVDALVKKRSLTPAEAIACSMGMSWLDDSLVPANAEDIFTALFGGL